MDSKRSFLASSAGVAFGIVLLAVSLLKEPLHPALLAYPFRSALALGLGLVLGLHPRFSGLRFVLSAALFTSPERIFRGCLFGSGFLLTLLLSLIVFGGTSHLDDGVAAVFQARIFATGKIVLPPPDLAVFFQCFGVLGPENRLAHWCGMYPPGWPALLTPGVLVGATWLVNPILFGCLCLATVALGTEVYDNKVGRMAGLLTATSPLLLILGGEQLSHIPTALFLTLCAWAMLRLLHTGRTGYGVVIGLTWGMAFLCRPLTAVIVGGLLGLCILWSWSKALVGWKGLTAALLISFGAAGLMAGFQKVTTGDATTPGHKIGMGPRGKMGFRKLDRARTHTPELGVEWTMRRLRNINRDMLGWPIPFYILALWPFLRGRAGFREYWLLFPSWGLLLVFATYWYYEIYYPSRYISEATPLLLVLAARSMTGPAGKSPPWASAAAWTGMLFLLIASGPRFLERFHANYADVESVLPNVVRVYDITNAVVFMDSIHEGTDQFDPRNKTYATGFMRNDLALTGSVIYAQNIPARNVELMRRYPTRDHYLYRFNRRTSKARLYAMQDDGVTFQLTPIQPNESRWLEEVPPPKP